MYKNFTKNNGRQSRCTINFLLVMKLTTILCLVTIMQVTAARSFGQKITLNEKEASIQVILKKIRIQSGYDLFYKKDLLTPSDRIALNLTNASLEEALAACLAGTELTYSINGKIIVIKKKENTPILLPTGTKIVQDSLLRGKVIDAVTKQGIPGATVFIKNGKMSVATQSNGDFSINVPPGQVVFVSSIGYQTKQIAIKSFNQRVVVSLEEAVNSMKDVVINGVFARKAETNTGSQTTVTKEKLLQAGTVNIIQSLRNIDPSFSVIDNSVIGSNPNALPEINLRGQSTIPDLNGSFTTNPNLPLFILDGFETTLQRVVDLDMYRVNSVTLLKDAASKAIYGAKAANGVVVIETIRPVAGQVRVNYNTNIGYDMPDLSSYHLTNARQKLQAEVLGGVYTSSSPANQWNLMNDYNIYLNNVESGINTDWMAKPLRNGVVQRHSVRIEGGDHAFTYGITGTYNGTSGVMKGSSANTLAGNINLNYRSANRKLNVMNDLTVQNRKGFDSPWGSFSDYVAMNPYLPYEDANGNILKQINSVRRINADNNLVQSAVFNPAYNATINTFLQSKTTTVTNNSSLDWRINNDLRATGRFSFSKQIDESDRFLPADHTSFAAATTAVAANRRGSYTKGNGTANSYDGQLNFSYAKLLAGKHSVTANAGATITQNISYLNTYITEGFPNQTLDLPSLGLQYQQGSRLTGSESTVRDMGFFVSTNYSYDQRYNMDLTYRTSQSSLYGSENRWGNFWSAGLSWNLHNESFAKEISWLNQWRLRGSTGFTGTQGFSPYMSLGTYSYVRELSYSGNNGAILLGLANPDLKWQRKQDHNFGIDMGFIQKISARIDYYISNTDGTLTDITLPPSTGFASYKANLGKVENKGIELNATYNILQKRNKNDRFNTLSIFASVAKNKNTLKQISNSLQAFNNRQNSLSSLPQGASGFTAAQRDSALAANRANISRPKVLFVEGQSMNAIYAVRSLGIDPATGREVYQKLDGTTTYDWNVNDQVVVGNSLPDWQGNLGFNFVYNGFRLNATFRYQFGGQQYNSTLVDRIENANIYNNVDIRFLTDRWRAPGDVSFFKNIADRTATRVSSRFVEDNNTFTLGSLQVGYDLDNLSSIRRLGFSQLRASISSSEVFFLSTMRVERGTSYPFARTVQLTLNANF